MPDSGRQTLRELARTYHHFVEEAARTDPGFRCVLLGHDRRGRDEFQFAAVIYDSLPPHLAGVCQRLTAPCSFQEMRAICARLDLVITARMHLSIASLGEGTPVGGIVYRDKFEGLIQGHFRLDDVLITPEKAFAAGGLNRLLRELRPRLSEMRETIRERLPRVLELAEANFDERTRTGEKGTRA
jgi:polysaccharide pyruvyl transferase WcaK-like protein